MAPSKALNPCLVLIREGGRSDEAKMRRAMQARNAGPRHSKRLEPLQRPDRPPFDGTVDQPRWRLLPKR